VAVNPDAVVGGAGLLARGHDHPSRSVRHRGGLERVAEGAAEWQRVFALDTHGCFNLVQAAVPLLTQQGGGSLVAVTTVQFTRPELRGVLSAAPKGAVEMLFRAVAAESARFGIRANTVRAGWIDAGMTDSGIGGQMSEEALRASLARIPMARMGRPRDIAEAVVFLTSQRASYITGTALTVDGGMSL